MRFGAPSTPTMNPGGVAHYQAALQFMERLGVPRLGTRLAYGIKRFRSSRGRNRSSILQPQKSTPIAGSLLDRRPQVSSDLLAFVRRSESRIRLLNQCRKARIVVQILQVLVLLHVTDIRKPLVDRLA